MTPWSEFLPDVMQFAPGVPMPVAEHYIRRAAQDFCRQTRVWQLDLDPTLTVAGQADYDLELEPDSELVRLEALDGYVTVGANCHVPLIPRTDKRDYYSAVYYSDFDKTFTVKPTPTTAGVSIVLRASLMPGNQADGIEDGIFAKYVETIAKRAGANLMLQPGKAWSNPALSGGVMTLYQADVDSIKTKLWRGMSNARPRARGMQF